MLPCRASRGSCDPMEMGFGMGGGGGGVKFKTEWGFGPIVSQGARGGGGGGLWSFVPDCSLV
jgi:hypothetical protein